MIKGVSFESPTRIVMKSNKISSERIIEECLTPLQKESQTFVTNAKSEIENDIDNFFVN
jgi:hypothetical protein